MLTPPADNREEMLNDVRDRFRLNRTRCQNLLQSVDSSEGDHEKSLHGDILRAVVVFTHASLEDLLRTILGYYYQSNPGKIIAEASKAEKVALLVRIETLRPDSTIADLFAELIREKLGLENFSNTSQICSMLDRVGLEIPDREAYLGQVGELIRRRHEIVHNADLEQVQNPAAVMTLDFDKVDRWLARAGAFGEEVIGALNGWSMGEPES